MKARWMFVVLAMSTAACATSEDDNFGTTPKKDSGATTETGANGDSMPPGEETGSPTDDGSVPGIDTGMKPEDTGTAPADTGTAPDDTGTSPTDTGTSPTDTGTPPTDTGTPSTGHVGDPCSVDGDCHPTTGAGSCTKDYFALGDVDPTPVCFQPSSCTPSTTSSLNLCDASHGICIGTGTTATSGTCFPLCQFNAAGTFSTSCNGKNACNLQFVKSDGTVYGRCVGGCTTDSDCPSTSKCDPTDLQCYATCSTDSDCTSRFATSPTGWKCDTTRGACTFSYPKTLGATCTSSSDCPCLKSTTAASGLCTKSCVTGATSCGTGYTCDALLPTTITKQPNGVSAFCVKNCSTATDCPTGQTCSASGGLTQKTCHP